MIISRKQSPIISPGPLELLNISSPIRVYRLLQTPGAPDKQELDLIHKLALMKQMELKLIWADQLKFLKRCRYRNVCKSGDSNKQP